MNKKIIVYGLTKERTEEKMSVLLKEYRESGLVEFEVTGFMSYGFKLRDGTTVISVTATDPAKAGRWHYAYIDMDLPSEIVQHMILPCGNLPLEDGESENSRWAYF